LFVSDILPGWSIHGMVYSIVYSIVQHNSEHAF
jgi:hypothetical protein